MKDTNKEKSPYATFSMDTVKPSGEKPEKEEFIGAIITDEDLRHKGAKVR
jgi:hypothetical protein